MNRSHQDYSILNLKKGNSFKGHSLYFNSTANHKNEAQLTYYNNYFDDTSLQVYNISNDETTINISLKPRTSKWYREKLKAMYKMYSVSGDKKISVFELNCIKIKEYDTQITLYEDFVLAQFSKTMKGLHFLNHRDNILLIKYFNKEFSRFLFNLKRESLESFINLEIENVDNVGSLDIPTGFFARLLTAFKNTSKTSKNEISSSPNSYLKRLLSHKLLK